MSKRSRALYASHAGTVDRAGARSAGPLTRVNVGLVTPSSTSLALKRFWALPVDDELPHPRR